MNVYTVYLPLTFNDGTDASKQVEALKSSALVTFGGYTLGAEMLGVWMDSDDFVYRDRIVPLILFAPDEQPVIKLAESAAKLLDQHYISVIKPDNTSVLIGRAG